jgi:acetyl esterase/lipase
MKQWIIAVLSLTTMNFCSGQDSSRIYLWQDHVPLARGQGPDDRPYIMVYTPRIDLMNGVSVLICPGGGYTFLAMDHEGRWVATWLNSLGITAFVLHYRINNGEGTGYHYPAELLDVQRAMRVIRSRAPGWGLDPGKMGVMGFSAGGHLASTLGTHFDLGGPAATDSIDRASCRPDFMILIYPVITFKPPYAHVGSARAFLGPNPSQSLVDSFSNETMVTSTTPPCFLLHANDDDVVPVENSINFYLALHHAGVPAVLHIIDHGRHGFGFMPGKPLTVEWTDMLKEWLIDRKLLSGT